MAEGRRKFPPDSQPSSAGPSFPRPAAEQPKSAPKPKPTNDDSALEKAIRDRAYQIWEEKGRPHGTDVDIWLQARKEILGKKQA